MIFVKTDDLKAGMRLAKPIYNKSGVLLYDRNSKLTVPGISSVRNFGLIGVYILEPAEPVPPLTKEDIEFEQRQTVYMFQLRDAYDAIEKHKPLDALTSMVGDILKHYGHLEHRINFNQNLRSTDDFIYKHSISVALLVAMIGHRAGLDSKTLEALVVAGLLYNYGLRYVPRPILDKGDDLEFGEQDIVQNCLERGLDTLSYYDDRIPYIKKAYAIIQYHLLLNDESRRFKNPDPSIVLLDDILTVALDFDLATGIRMGEQPESEIMAMKAFYELPEIYNTDIADHLAQCIHIVPAGASVDLSTKDKGIVLVENPIDFMRPLILRLSNNQVYDLSNDTIYSHLQIVDIMKTMDNRIAIDEATLKQFRADSRIVETAKRFREVLYGV